jgi:ADP-ribose pyrophosphatase YjhB (NUDIX family)
VTGNINIRVRPSAAIIRNESILLIAYDDPEDSFHYNLPGGGLAPHEMIYDGLRRELQEEACAEIEIGLLLMV